MFFLQCRAAITALQPVESSDQSKVHDCVRYRYPKQDVPLVPAVDETRFEFGRSVDWIADFAG